MPHGLSEVTEVMAYATGLLVGDMWRERNPNQIADSEATEKFRDDWAATRRSIVIRTLSWRESTRSEISRLVIDGAVLLLTIIMPAPR